MIYNIVFNCKSSFAILLLPPHLSIGLSGGLHKTYRWIWLKFLWWLAYHK